MMILELIGNFKEKNELGIKRNEDFRNTDYERNTKDIWKRNSKEQVA